MKLTIAGCGDAFGSGGRLQTCYHVATPDAAFLIDCGATSLIGLERCGIDPGGIGTILVSHLHGDHFSGLVWWYLHAVHVAKRRHPLQVVGPPGIEVRFRAAAEILFPGSLAAPAPFELRFVELNAGAPQSIAGVGKITAWEVEHPSGAPSHALRIEAGGRTLAFSGDTEWVEALVECGRNADLFLCECYAFDRPPRYHLSWTRLSAELPRIGARRVVLTHMNADMLARADEVRATGAVEIAHDGLVIEV